MKLNMPVWLNALNFFIRNHSISGAALSFPIIDKAAKIRYPSKNKKDLNNKIRMINWFNDEFENTVEIGTGLRLNFSDCAKRKLQLGSESIGEIIYRVRCSVLHEIENPVDVKFDYDPSGMIFGCDTDPAGTVVVTVPANYLASMHLVALASPEYTSITDEFNGRRIKFLGAIITPSLCVGNYQILREQVFNNRS